MCLSIHWMHTSLTHKTMRHFTRFHLVGFALLSAMFITSCDPQNNITEPEPLATPSVVSQSGSTITIRLSNHSNPSVTSQQFNSLSNRFYNDSQVVAFLQQLTDWYYNYNKNLSSYQANKNVNKMAQYKNRFRAMDRSTKLTKHQVLDLGKATGAEALRKKLENPNDHLRKKAQYILDRYPEILDLPGPAQASVFRKASQKVRVRQEPPTFGGGLFGIGGLEDLQAGVNASSCNINKLGNYNDCVSLKHKRFMLNLAAMFAGEVIGLLSCLAYNAVTGPGAFATCGVFVSLLVTVGIMKSMGDYHLDLKECGSTSSNQHGCDCENSTLQTWLKGTGCSVSNPGSSGGSSGGLGTQMDRLQPPFQRYRTGEYPAMTDVVIIKNAGGSREEITVGPLVGKQNCSQYYSSSECSIMFA